MKRIIALVLVVIIALSCSILTVFAQSNKISLGLQEKLKNCDPDAMVPVSITYSIKTLKISDMPSWPGEAASAEYIEYCNSVQNEMQEQIFSGYVVVIRTSILSWSVIADVKARDIETLAENDAVREIEYFENGTYKAFVCEDEFVEFCQNAYSTATILSYDELYNHQDNDGKTDWILIYASTRVEEPMCLNTIIGNRVIMQDSCMMPFDTGYGIYDVQTGDFIDVTSVEARDYYGFTRVFDEIGTGRLIGDFDCDNEISSIDVTWFQRCEAAMCDYSEDNEIEVTSENPWNYSVRSYYDFNRDGEHDILDATCIQRYLAGMNYPVG